MLIVPRKRIWTQQPQQAAQIDSYWIKRGLRFVINPSAGLNNQGKFPLQNTGFVTGITQEGIVFAGNLRAEFGPMLPSANGLTLISVWMSRASSQYLGGDGDRIILGDRTSGNSGWSWGRSSAIGGGAGGNLTKQGFTINGVAAYEESNHQIESLVATPVAMRYSKDSGKVSWFRFGRQSSADTTATTSPSTGGNVVFGAQGEYSANLSPWIDRAGLTLGFVGELSDAEILELTGSVNSLWKVYHAPDSRIFVPTGAGAVGGDSLTASNIIASPATVGSPLLSQQHALTASSIATTPAIVATPAITQRHALSATAVAASHAVVGSPSITQRHALTATAISAAPAVVGSPALTEVVAGVLSALPVIAAPSVVGAPAITQRHVLSAGAISAGPATFGTPTLAQQHALMAQGISAGAAVVGAPALSEGGAAPFTAEQFLYLEANYVTIANINDIAAAVLAALQATAIPVNIKQVNDVTIKGIGTQSNPWNPV